MNTDEFYSRLGLTGEERREAEAIANLFLGDGKKGKMAKKVKNHVVLRYGGFILAGLVMSIGFAYAQDYAMKRLKAVFGIN